MSWWQIVWQTVQEDFADFADPAQLTRLMVRLGLAALLGGALGYERETKGKAAGLRTHMLVSVGSAFFVLIPQQAGMEIGDLSRVMQGLLTGIGFLGAGAIIKVSDHEEVKGLTTAASIWMAAAVGMAAGLGKEASAILATVWTLVILAVVLKFEGGIKPD